MTVVHEGGRSFTATFGSLDPSVEPEVTPEETFTPPSEEGMLIEYTWPDSEEDLNTAVALFDGRDGAGCFSSSDYINYFGDDDSFGGTESSGFLFRRPAKMVCGLRLLI